MIRYTEPLDGPYLHDIDIKSYDHSVWKTRRFITTDTYVYVADKRPVAFVSWQHHNEDELLILKLAVTPSFRRQGIGTILLNSVLSRGLITTCVVFEHDLEAQLMLKKNSFKYLRTVIKVSHTLYTMENKNGIDNLAGSVVNGNVRSNDPQVGGSGIAGPEIAGFEPPQDYP